MTVRDTRFYGMPLSGAAAVVVAVHGRDQDGGYMADHLVAPLHRSLPSMTAGVLAWVVPESPEQSWYPARYDAPMGENEPQLGASLGRLDRIADRILAAGVEPERTVWVGFSQGACLVLEYMLRHPKRWGGVAVLTGAVLGPDGADRSVSGAFAGTPFYFGVGDADPWMPASAAEAAATVVRRAGAAAIVDVTAADQHEIKPNELAAVAEMIEDVVRAVKYGEFK